jgi:hypothetical protein
MRKSKYIPFIYIFFCFLTFFGGCGKREFCKLPAEMDFEEIEPLANKLKVGIFYDASLSMLGFVNPSNSYYIRTLQLAERAFISGWPDGSVDYYKFGTIIDKIDRPEALKAANAKFYNAPEFRKETRIENVIDNIDFNSLTIIITDLFQNDADVNLLLEKFKQKFLSEKDIAVGVLGIKSQFNGMVYDVGIEGLPFEYLTRGLEAIDFRPFYVLMFGKYKNIQHYYKMLKTNGLDEFPEKNFVIFSPRLVNRLASFENAALSETSKITEVENVLSPGRKYRHVKQFMVNENSQKAYFDTAIELPLLPYGLAFDPTQLNIKIRAWQWQEIKKELEICGEIIRAISIKDFTLSGTQLKFRTEICSTKFPRNGIYCFEIVIHPPLDSYSLPRWIFDWDMDQNLITLWREDPNQFKGNSTLNLKNFLSNVWQIIYQKHEPKIAKFYFFINKK